MVALCACGKPLYVDKRGFVHSSCKTCKNRKHHRRQKQSRRERGLRPRAYTTVYFRRRRKFIQGKHCAWCMATKQLTIDHITPLADGGRLLDKRNWRVLCHDCHEEATRLTHFERALRAISPTTSLIRTLMS